MPLVFLQILLLIFKANFFFLVVFNPIDPITGLEVGASKKSGKKRERSSSATLEHIDAGPSASKKVATEELISMRSNKTGYTFIWFRQHKLNNLIVLAKWAKLKFRHGLLTNGNPYPDIEARLLLGGESYTLSKETHPNFPPETSQSFPSLSNNEH